MTNITQQNATTVLRSYQYTLDNAGNRLSVIENGGNSLEWAYDDAYRLLNETGYDSLGSLTTQTNFTYDNTGNRLTQSVDGLLTEYAYNDLDQLLTSTTNAVTTTYSYDDRGNLSEILAPEGNTAFAWDAQDRMIGVTLPDATEIANTYDADGFRVSQTVAGVETNFLWDMQSSFGDVVVEYDAAGNPLVDYVLGDGRLVSQHQGGASSFYLHDGQHSTRALTDMAGNITDNYAYDAFGEFWCFAKMVQRGSICRHSPR